MALLSFCGFDTPSLPAQGEQRRSSYFNIPRGNSPETVKLIEELRKLAREILASQEFLNSKIKL